jgi:gliding motility-associated-like protein
VTVTDNNLGCTDTFSFSVPDNSTPATVTLNGITPNTSCLSPFNGGISISAGGTPGPFTIAWTGPNGFTSSAASFNSAQPGNYTVVVTDNVLGCTATNTYNVPNMATGCGGLNCFAFTITTDPILTQRPSCTGQNNGIITLNITGNTPGNYIITLLSNGNPVHPPQIGPSGVYQFSNLSPDDYEYMVEDQAANVCIKPFTLSVETTVEAAANGLVNASCFGESTGQATLSVLSGGNAPYEYSLNNGANWTSFTSPHTVTNLAPDGTYSILVRDDATDQCPDEVMVTILNATQPIQATFDIEDATCDGNDGSITVASVTGGSGSGYQFAIDGGSFGGGPFTGLAGGDHIITVKDGTCFVDLTASVTFPGFIDADIDATNASCTNNGNSGSIEVTIDAPGSYRVALSTDQFNEPEDAMYQNYSGPFVTFDELASDHYFIYAKSSASVCPTRIPVQINGIQAITFDIEQGCQVGTGSNLDKPFLFIKNIKGNVSPSAPQVSISIRNKFTGAEISPGKNVNLSQGVNSAFFDFDSNLFMRTPGEYVIKMSQVDPVFFCEVTSSENYTVPERLVASIGRGSKESYPDIPTGFFEVINFSGGITPYETRIELDSASSLAIPFYQTEFEEVELNDNQQFEKPYDKIPAGRYQVHITDSVGCSIELIARVRMDDNVYIPNIFTPNDDGSNDIFYIRNLPVEANNVKLVITSRWGKQIYSSDSYQNDWKGEGAADGIYFYQLSLDGADPIAGWVEVLRGQKP